MKAITRWARRNGQYHLLQKTKLHPEFYPLTFSDGKQVLRLTGFGEVMLIGDFFTLPKIGKTGRPHLYLEHPKGV